MRARELAEDYPSVSLDDDALDAARLLAGQRLPGLVVTENDGEPYAILPASRLIKVLVPDYIIEDPALAAVIDERHADRLGQALAGRSVRDCLPRERQPLPAADADDTVMEVAAVMARQRSPLVAVVERDKAGLRTLGVITAAHLLERLLGAA
jgi:predicted transcriptional regulator